MYIAPRLYRPSTGCPSSARREGLTATPCVCIHIGRILRGLLKAARVAAVPDFCELGLNLLHADFHVDDSLGGVEKAAVARPEFPSASCVSANTVPIHTPRATAASLDSRRHCGGAAAQAFEPRVWDTGTRPPTIGRREDRAHRST